jgi:flagellar motor switch protein FliN/FliY
MAANDELQEPIEETNGEAPEADPYRQNLQRILDLQLPVTVSFGSTRRPLAEVLKYGPGSLIELDKLADEPVVLKVNDKVLAWGKVVDVDGYYGIEITRIVDRADRIASLGGES